MSIVACIRNDVVARLTHSFGKLLRVARKTVSIKFCGVNRASEVRYQWVNFLVKFATISVEMNTTSKNRCRRAHRE